jgi:hypothetical protein
MIKGLGDSYNPSYSVLVPRMHTDLWYLLFNQFVNKLGHRVLAPKMRDELMNMLRSSFAVLID